MLKIRKIGQDERPVAIDLISTVFMRFEAPDYPEEGIETFMKIVIYNNDFLKSLEMYGAYKNQNLVGVIATRNNGNHIALFFVDGKYHRQGIGTKLFETVLENSTSDEITVNSSPYAVIVYHHLGFIDTVQEQITNGMRYTPMVYRK